MTPEKAPWPKRFHWWKDGMWCDDDALPGDPRPTIGKWVKDDDYAALACKLQQVKEQLQQLQRDHLFFMSCVLTQFDGQLELKASSIIGAPNSGSIQTWDDKVSGSRFYRLSSIDMPGE